MSHFKTLNMSTALLLIVLMLGFTACKKCMNCTSSLKSNGTIVDTYPESCGKKGTLDAQELNYRANLPDSISISCSRN
jgi:hypothetical protein